MDHTRAGSVVVRIESGHTVTDTAQWWKYIDGVVGRRTGRVEAGSQTWKEFWLLVVQYYKWNASDSHHHLLFLLSPLSGMIDSAMKTAFITN